MQETIQNQKPPVFSNTVLYAAFSSIPLDIEGSNISQIGFIPSASDLIHFGKEKAEMWATEFKEKNKHVLFKNINLKWDSCDCGDGFGCSHPDWVYQIEVKNKEKNHTIELNGNGIEAYNNNRQCVIPEKNVSVYDFFRMCEMLEIELELSDYALSILK